MNNLEEALRLLEAAPAHLCILCGATSSVGALLIPREPNTFGAPAGKRRLIRYDLCRRCSRRENLTDLVEGRLLSATQDARAWGDRPRGDAA